MKKIIVPKAQPAYTGQIVEDVTIEISGELTSVFNDLADLQRYYREQMKPVHDALRATLPGGMLDQLRCLLMESGASYLAVSEKDV